MHPELVGLTIKLPAGSYLIHGNTPLECYSYGRTETVYKDIWGYAAPCGEAYGSHALPNPPNADISPTCGEWSIRVHESGSGGGIADVMLLDDSNGFYVKPPQVSFNCSLLGYGTDPHNIFSPPFIVGDTSLDFTIQVNDPSRDAYAPVEAVDLSGNDTVIQLSYKAPSFTLPTGHVIFPDTIIGTQECLNLTLQVASTGSFSLLSLFDSVFNSSLFHVTTIPALPAQLKAGDSVIFNICYTPQDTTLHKDSILVIAGCLDTTISMEAKGITPIIFASDLDFGTVLVGDTICKPLTIRNIGEAPLILNQNWSLQITPDFSFQGSNQLPDTILPGSSITVEFCFHPQASGPAEARMNWVTNLTGLYQHQLKDTSLLTGNGTMAGVASAPQPPPFALSISPNPTSGVATISLTGAPSAKVEIFDVLGREVASFRVGGSYEWQMSTLPAGTYIVRASIGGAVVSKRVVKE